MEQQGIESEQAFEAGFNEARSIEPTEKPIEQKPEPEPTEVVAETPKDPWEGVNPAVKETLDSLTSKLAIVDKFPDRLRNIEGHIGGLTNQIKTALASAKAVEKKGLDAPSDSQIERASVSSEKWKQIQEDYPEWAEAMEERLALFKPSIPPPPKVDLDGFRSDLETRMNGAISDASREMHGAIVSIKHEGWQETVKTSDFTNWFKGQAPELRALADSPRAVDAIRLLDAFKAAKNKQDKEARLKDAITPQGQVATGRHINEDDAFENGFARARGG